MRVVTAAQMRTVEERAAQLGMDALCLMENAGRAVAEAVREVLRHTLPGGVLVVAGVGQNGGDGLVAARHLRAGGVPVQVWALRRPEDWRGAAAENARRAAAVGVALLGEAEGRRELERAAVVVDAVLGTGLAGPVRPEVAAVLELMAAQRAPVVAVDIPSGVGADDGRLYGPAPRARVTVTFGALKPGLLLYPGREYAGEVRVEPLGLAGPVWDGLDPALEAVTGAEAQALLPRRTPTAHKGTRGRVLVVAGSTGMIGAAVLAARGALCSGAGLVQVAVPACWQPTVAAAVPEALTAALPEEGGRLSPAAAPVVRELAQACQAVAAGPGLSVGEGTWQVVQSLLDAGAPLVLDADALNTLSRYGPDVLRGARAPVALTPHPGEMGRLVGRPAREVDADRIQAALAASRRFGCAVLLKGAPTVVADPSGHIRLLPVGNPELGTGGSGDVLTGLVAGLLAQGLAPAQALVLGAYLHGAAGDRLAAEGRGFTAADLPRGIREGFRRLETGEGT